MASSEDYEPGDSSSSVDPPPSPGAANKPSVSSRCQQWQERVDNSLARRESEKYVEAKRNVCRTEVEDRRAVSRLVEKERKTSTLKEETDEMLAKALAETAAEENPRRRSQVEIERVIALELRRAEGGGQELEVPVEQDVAGSSMDDESMRLVAQLEQEDADLALAALLKKQEERRASGEVSQDMLQEDVDMLVALQLQDETERRMREEQDAKLAKQLMEKEQCCVASPSSNHQTRSPRQTAARLQSPENTGGQAAALSKPKSKLLSIFNFGKKKST
eukprot:GHVS01024670.1.p1 GENE.GHVS01024670.1~~GHVS01024670.1.p1  ORF type:complete len:277 (+),score=81.31 GHVS01024670.1:146-976(+)